MASEVVGRLLSGAVVAGLGILASTPAPAGAAGLASRGLIELDHGSNITGIPRHSRYSVDSVLDGAELTDQAGVLQPLQQHLLQPHLRQPPVAA